MYNTHDNHFEFGWGKGRFNFANKKQKYWVKFGRAKYFPKSFKDECIRAANLINVNANKPILIFFSGGIDSEIVVRSFLAINVSIEVAIMKLKWKNNDHINKHDTKYAYNFCHKHNIKIHEVTIDIEESFNTFVMNIAKEYTTDRFGIIIQHELIRYFPNYHIVFGGGDIKLIRYRELGEKRPGLCILENPLAVQAIEVANSVKTIVSDRFFCHTPELMLSWLLEPDVQHWIQYEVALNSYFGSINNHSIKSFVLYKIFPDLEIRPKLNGFETWELLQPEADKKDPINFKRLKLKKLYGNGNTQTIRIDYKDLYKMLIPL